MSTPVFSAGIRTKLAAFAAISVIGTATACSAGLESLPLPAPTAGSDTYSLTATFANALNLPAKAKVRLAGADVGEVDSMTARNYTAVVTMKIRSDVEIPVGTTVELRSATPLGDVFVALKAPPRVAGAPMLRSGDSIPLEGTKSAATIEEVLSTSSLLVNGGAVRNLTKIVNGLGAALGGKGESLGQLLDESRVLLDNLAARSEAIKGALSQTSDLAATLSARQQTIDDALNASNPALSTISDNTGRIVDLVAQVNRITLQLAKFPSIRGEKSRSMMADLNRLSSELNDAATAPGESVAAINRIFGPVVKLTNATSAHVDIDLQDVAVGAFADPHHPIDPGSRGPDRSDVRNFIGSISYELMRLRDKVWGPPTPPPGTVPPPDAALPGPAPVPNTLPGPPVFPPPLEGSSDVPPPASGGTP
ncbi:MULTISPECIES: MCE family protein [unclassified Mycobacterium]|uniref:MlaD family protein n=1 Tax=unclassified Mycobacterium TaxID=2642494 RepID=UPI0029C93409|nr:MULTISPECIES: MCE family protein [unclassified Mycobacterium]